MVAVFEYTEPIELGRNLEVYSADNGLMRFYTDGAGIALGLREVAALHKALGDHLEANKPRLPASGAIKFPDGSIAARDAAYPNWVSTDGGEYSDDDLILAFGTDWVELVPKDA